MKTSAVGRFLLSGALSFLLFLTSCGKKEAAPESAKTPADTRAVDAPELPVKVKSNMTNSFRLASFTPSAPVPPKPAAPVAATNVPALVTNVVERPVPVVPNEKPAEVVEPVRPVDPRTESEWAAARAMLKFTGSMKMGGQQVAMVNDKILRKGDTISVMFHEKEFTFIVTIISPNGVEYKRELTP